MPGGYRLNGTKIWCTNANIADFILVAAKTLAEDGSPLGINLFIVGSPLDGLTIGRKEDKIGARGVPSCPLFLDDAFVAESGRLGPEGGRGFKVAMEALNCSRPVVAARDDVDWEWHTGRQIGAGAAIELLHAHQHRRVTLLPQADSDLREAIEIGVIGLGARRVPTVKMQRTIAHQ